MSDDDLLSTQAPTLHYLDDHGGCPVCDCGHVLHVEPDGSAFLCDLHYTDRLGTPGHVAVEQ